MPTISSAASFWSEARWQRVCAVCGQGGGFHAHHCLPKQHLRRLGLPLYDTRNALRLCDTCHMQFEWGGPGKVQLPLHCLTENNICYLYEVLGPAIVTLERKYGSFEHEPRWHKHRMGECESCQLQPPM